MEICLPMLTTASEGKSITKLYPRESARWTRRRFYASLLNHLPFYLIFSHSHGCPSQLDVSRGGFSVVKVYALMGEFPERHPGMLLQILWCARWIVVAFMSNPLQHIKWRLEIKAFTWISNTCWWLNVDWLHHNFLIFLSVVTYLSTQSSLKKYSLEVFETNVVRREEICHGGSKNSRIFVQ